MSASTAPAHRDRVLGIDCEGHALVGLLSEPVRPATPTDAADITDVESVRDADTGVLLLVGGPQYRVGSHRQFTLLGRALAGAGVPCLRLDHRGLGDAGGDQRSFDTLDADIAAAIDAWQRERPALRRVVLWGLCDAASAALLYVHRRRDPRVAGLCLANPWVRTEASLARTQVKHYYLDRLRQPAFWRKLLSGRVGLGAVRELLGKLAQSRAAAPSAAAGAPGAADTRHYTEQMADGLRAFGGPVLLILSGDDYVAKEFLDRCRDGGPAWHGLLARPGLRREDLADADHTFSTADWRAQVERLTAGFVRDALPA
ncbi:hydrolase 1, exosortase A system-associated [Mitsuaria sp. GD03876]|uniref:hydrolase 1, exosortase A system-associated n=1 Tax=Mitsuaria sp. GD03876 TaxID=2975399 RepID=UPI002446F2D4|nr:hydrolase 1, exosortase A system-associated [Mitsuaria sp. GD03876]MDH0867771.1 hydrolase 1, exosortase A system-associated [Mitsuaria sp. GD03876]